MAFAFLIPIIYLLFNTKINFKGLNKNYLNKNNTLIVNALFVIMVFFRHFSQYGLKPPFILDRYFFRLVSELKQLIVVSFLFFSGYGIYECIKNKKDYLKTFAKKRYLKTYLNFAIAVLLFVMMNLIIHIDVGVLKTILAFTGWESIGNSNWYMLAIFFIYAFILLAFNICKDHKKSLIIVTILSIIYVILISYLKGNYYGDTVLCFASGMWYSYYKDKIDKKITNKNYYPILIISLLLFVGLFLFYRIHNNVILFNIVSISFMLFVVLVLMKLELNGKLLIRLGTLTFWFYILQRIPMTIFKRFNLNIIIYFYLSLITTYLISELFNYLTNKMYK